MRRGRLVATLGALLLGLALGVTGCEPLDDLGGGGGFAPVSSDLPCRDDSECTTNGCCGQATAITHVDATDAPRSCGPCTNNCSPPDSVDCGRCVPTCRASRCSAACSF
jgi:hypothetical protein